MGIKALLIVNTALFLLAFFLRGPLAAVLPYLVLSPTAVVRSFQLWQLGTYQFLHFNVLNFVFNMLALWMFGRELEGSWGTDRFLRFYFLCGAGAGVFVIALGYLFGAEGGAVAGSNGAIYGILAASAALAGARRLVHLLPDEDEVVRSPDRGRGFLPFLWKHSLYRPPDGVVDRLRLREDAHRVAQQFDR